MVCFNYGDGRTHTFYIERINPKTAILDARRILNKRVEEQTTGWQTAENTLICDDITAKLVYSDLTWSCRGEEFFDSHAM